MTADDLQLDDLQYHLSGAARELNRLKVPKHRGNQLVDHYRLDDMGPMSRKGQAETMGVDQRHLYRLRNNHSSKDASARDLAERAAKLTQYDGVTQPRIVASIQGALTPKGMTELALRKLLGIPESELGAILQDGLVEGYWTRKGRSYLATGKYHQPPRPVSVSERAGRLERTMAIVLSAKSRHQWVISSRLSREGLELVRDQLIYRVDEAETDFLARRAARRDQETRERTGRDFGRTDGLAITAGYPRNPIPGNTYGPTIGFHLSHYIRDFNIDITRMTCGLDARARSALVKKDIPAMIREIRAVMSRAAKLGADGDKQVFAVTLTYANLQ